MFSQEVMRKLEIALASKELAAILAEAIEQGTNEAIQADIDALETAVGLLDGRVTALEP